MPLLVLQDVSLAFGHAPLLERVSLSIERGERVCLVGRNGTGKSTLLKLIAGLAAPDSGEIRLEKQARLGYLHQEPMLDEGGSVFENVAGGLGGVRDVLIDYHRASAALAESPEDAALLARLQGLQEQLEAENGWTLSHRVEETLSLLGLNADTPVARLSGGWKRRVALARALVAEPDLLLLDEPTNHLDIEAIDWLEKLLAQFKGALLFVTHDRRFLQQLATRILDLDRGTLASFPGDYANYLRRKEEMLAAEAQAQALFDKRLAQEEVWIRKGIQARRTRNEGRVRALQKMRAERVERRQGPGQVRLRLDDTAQSGKLVIEAENVGYAWDGRPIVRDFSLRILRGDRIGLIGPNGAGKTTLLRLLLKQLAPDAGEVRHGTQLAIAYFDQLRAQLDPEARVVDCVGEGKTSVTVNGANKHVMSYLQDFLFPPERARAQVKALSGGERNRLLLAQLFTRPANLLVMDEPTNDLDVETLELLEELLTEYSGTLLLVSHDRAFLDNVVTSCLVFEGDGRVREYVGGYSDWLRQRPAPAEKEMRAPAKPAPPIRKIEAREKRKLSYKEQRELDDLPARIEALEQEQRSLQAQLADPALYADTEAVRVRRLRLKELESALREAYARWEALEAAQQA